MMKLPKNFNTSKHLLKVIVQIHNRRVADTFDDVIKDRNNSKTTKGRQSLYQACLVRTKDTWLEVNAKLQLFYLVLGNGRGDAIATLPEFWAVKNPRNRAQLCIVYKIKNKTGYSSTTYQLSIPNYNGSMKPTKIDSYRKGNYLGTLHLTDGSKLRINAKDKTECERVRDIMVGYIRKPMLKDSVWRCGERKDELKDVVVVPIRADFYPRGKTKGTEPKWRYYYPI